MSGLHDEDGDDDDDEDDYETEDEVRREPSEEYEEEVEMRVVGGGEVTPEAAVSSAGLLDFDHSLLMPVQYSEASEGDAAPPRKAPRKRSVVLPGTQRAGVACCRCLRHMVEGGRQVCLEQYSGGDGACYRCGAPRVYAGARLCGRGRSGSRRGLRTPSREFTRASRGLGICSHPRRQCPSCGLSH